MELAWATRTDVGRVRKRNEDAVLATASVFAVADGMGGHSAGDLASALTTESLRELSSSGVIDRPSLLGAIRRADERIREHAQDSANGMGTTVSGFALGGPRTHALVFNVGDSRSYRLREGRLVQLTHDHSVVQELIDSGAIDEQHAELHPDRNVITRSLGAPGHLEIDWWDVPLALGDRFLICSDGLTKELDTERIAMLLRAAASVEVAADDLMAAALDAGGRDNVSVVVVEVIPDSIALIDSVPGFVDRDDTAPRPRPTDPGPDASGGPVANPSEEVPQP